MSNREMDILKARYKTTETIGMNSLVAYKIYCNFYGLAEGNYINFRRFMEVYYNVK